MPIMILFITDDSEMPTRFEVMRNIMIKERVQ